MAEADARALLLNSKVRLIFNILEAQRSGVQGVVGFVGLTRYHCAVQLGVVADVNLIAAFAGKQPGLLLHAVIVAVEFIAAGIEARCAVSEGTHGGADARAGVVLLAVIALAVLLAA